MDLPYYKELVMIRKFLEKNLSGFPKQKCQHATKLVWWIEGIEEVAGAYTPLGGWHAWNYDRARGLYIDLTLDQFENEASPLAIFSHTSEILKIHPTHTINQQTIDQSELQGNFMQEVNRLYDLYLKRNTRP